jgi:hypothetical protein
MVMQKHTLNQASTETDHPEHHIFLFSERGKAIDIPRQGRCDFV